MQTPLPRLFRIVRFCRHGVLLAGLSLVGAACDGHSAREVPESYGHGSSHQVSVTDHEVDSENHTDHYSDTYGISREAEAGRPGAPGGPKTGEAHSATPNPMGIGH